MATRSVATVFGGSGFIGRHVVQRLARAGHVVRVAVRDTESAMFLKPMGAVGQVVLLRAPVTDTATVARAVEGADLVVNLVGILAEGKAGDFQRIHADGAGNVARAAAAAGVGRMVHLSAIGADAASPSLYAQSKAAGEAQVRAAMPGAVILRPSVVFGADDAFFNRFATMARLLWVMPVIGGDTRLQPVFVGDVADAVMAGLTQAAAVGRTFELGGPRVATLRELQAWVLTLVQRKRMLIDVPGGIAALQAKILERLPGKLLTQDQLKLLSRDNVVAADAAGLAALGISPTPMELVVPQYLGRYRPGGVRRESFAVG
jgi:NADH dehydrogenase